MFDLVEGGVDEETAWRFAFCGCLASAIPRSFDGHVCIRCYAPPHNFWTPILFVRMFFFFTRGH